ISRLSTEEVAAALTDSAHVCQRCAVATSRLRARDVRVSLATGCCTKKCATYSSKTRSTAAAGWCTSPPMKTAIFSGYVVFSLIVTACASQPAEPPAAPEAPAVAPAAPPTDATPAAAAADTTPGAAAAAE